MTRPVDADDPFAEEEDRRREAQERRDRQLDKAPVIIEPKDGSHIPPDVAARQERFYREILGLGEETDGSAG